MKVGGVLFPVLIIVFVFSTFYVSFCYCVCFVFYAYVFVCFFVFVFLISVGGPHVFIKMGGISSGWVTDVAKIGMSYNKFAVFGTLCSKNYI